MQKIAGRALTSTEKDLDLPKLKDPRYVVLTVRRNELGKLKATAYDSRSANEYEVVGTPYWWKDMVTHKDDPQVHLSFGGLVDPHDDKKGKVIDILKNNGTAFIHCGAQGAKKNVVEVGKVGRENLDDVDYVDSKVWRVLKRNFSLGEQITPRVKLSAFTSPLKGPTKERKGVDEYIGEVEIPVSMISGLAGIVSDEWTTLFSNNNEKLRRSV